jgi:hypothetical protein
MNAEFVRFLTAAEQDRRDAFAATAQRLGTTPAYVEKDFWVCWALDALYHGMPPGPRLLFKGGTSLSKGFGLISRFSEDIDVTVFREDLGQGVSLEELEQLSSTKRKARMLAVKVACQPFIQGPVREHLTQLLGDTMRAANLSGRAGVDVDADDPDQQSLVLWYPTVFPADAYVRAAVKIESGARSALDPHSPKVIRPYVADELAGFALDVAGVTTVAAERTFWDKVVILHGQRAWFQRRGELRQQGQRVSRHYYDVHRLAESPLLASAMGMPDLARDCARHARMFFGNPDMDLERAVPGNLAIAPADGMVEAIAGDYARMSNMIFGPRPQIAAVLASIARVEGMANQLK